jgi:hypothetical protein
VLSITAETLARQGNLVFVLAYLSMCLSSLGPGDLTEVYFVQGSKLSKLDQQAQITAVRTLSADIMGFCGPSYYSRGSTFSMNYDGQPFRVELGSL